jgi:hypothetical protein
MEITFVKHDGRNTEQGQVGGFRCDGIRVLLKAIGDINKRTNLKLPPRPYDCWA